MNDTTGGPPPPEANGEATRLSEKARVLERHVDHLMGQLVHQVDIIERQKAQVAHLQNEIKSIGDSPKLLDQSLSRIVNLKEEMAGRREIELDLRRRIEELEREEQVKTRHIRGLESYLNRVWNSPHRRLFRALKNGVNRLLGRPPRPGPFEDRN